MIEQSAWPLEVLVSVYLYELRFLKREMKGSGCKVCKLFVVVGIG